MRWKMHEHIAENKRVLTVP